MGSMLPYIAAPWIRHGCWMSLSFVDFMDSPQLGVSPDLGSCVNHQSVPHTTDL